MDRGLALFAERQDKDWSLTDCISFVVMGEQGIAEALTADHRGYASKSKKNQSKPSIASK
jgi:predicted nucleic acid-binding protein